VDSRLTACQQEFAQLLSPASGAGWIRLPSGGVLLHEGHVAAGVFVAASGILSAASMPRVGHRRARPLCRSSSRLLGLPNATSWSVKTESDLMFFPRPVTLYKEQWTKLLDMADDIRAFIRANELSLKTKS
jgi:hypothetical protein